MNTHAHVCTRTRTNTRTHTHRSSSVQKGMQMCLKKHAHTRYACTHTRLHVRMHTRTHTYMYPPLSSRNKNSLMVFLMTAHSYPDCHCEDGNIPQHSIRSLLRTVRLGESIIRLQTASYIILAGDLLGLIQAIRTMLNRELLLHRQRVKQASRHQTRR